MNLSDLRQLEFLEKTRPPRPKAPHPPMPDCPCANCIDNFAHGQSRWSGGGGTSPRGTPLYMLPTPRAEGCTGLQIELARAKRYSRQERQSRLLSEQRRVEDQIESDMVMAADLQLNLYERDIIQDIETDNDQLTDNSTNKDTKNHLSGTLEILSGMSNKGIITEGKYLEFSDLLMKVYKNL